MRRRPHALAACGAALLACFAIAACGGSKDAIKSSTTAEQLVKSLRQQRCQQKVSDVRCESQGDAWNCTYTHRGKTGELNLPKAGTGQLAMSC